MQRCGLQNHRGETISVASQAIEVRKPKMKITDFLVFDGNGEEMQADAFGNNVAFSCPACLHPVLATALENQRGSDEEHPSECKGCGRRYFLDLRLQSKKLYIHDLEDFEDMP